MNILEMSISSGILILIIAGIRVSAVNKLPKTMFITLWAVALGRLIIPFSIASRYSVYDIFKAANALFIKKPQVTVPSSTQILFYQEAQPILRLYELLQTKLVFLIWIAGMAVWGLFFAISFYRSYR